MSITEVSSLRNHYSRYYTSVNDHDSPRLSRTQIVRSITGFILAGEGCQSVLNIGSGRRELEGALVRNAKSNVDRTLHHKLSHTSLISFDIADIPARRMIGPKGSHVQADSRSMPFKDETFDLSISNLSIDMLRREPGEFEAALGEASRVTKIGGTILFNYHPPELFEALSRYYAEEDDYVGTFYDGGDSNPYYKSDDAIAEDLMKVGIRPLSIAMRADERDDDSWWEVVGTRIV